MSRARRAGVVGAVVGLAAAAGVVAGVATERVLVRRARRGDDPYAGEKFGELPYDEALTVTAPDGAELAVEVVEPADGIELEADFAARVTGTPDPPPTVVFVHGFCLDLGEFHFQRKELARSGEWRAVFYDQPGHGRSGDKESGEYTMTELAEALRAVIEETTPAGQVVLVGHSMGGMTIIALAEAAPVFFAERVAGVVLIASSAGQLGDGTTGLPALVTRAGKPLLPMVGGAGRLTGAVIDRARRAAGDVAWLLTRRYGFGSRQPSPALVSYVEYMNTRTSTGTVARYLRTLSGHQRYPALAALRDKPALLVCGDRDPITPPRHTEQMKELLPDAELLVVPESGHMVLMEHADEVTRVLLEFLGRWG